jgi:ATP-dependent Clp protease, protease subunit
MTRRRKRRKHVPTTPPGSVPPATDATAQIALFKSTAYYAFTGPIESATATQIGAAMNQAVIDGHTNAHVIFSSPGGFVADGIYLYNHIRGLPIEVTIEAVGSVSSIALIVFLAAKHRFCSANAMFLTHPTTLSPQVGMSAERLDAALRAALADDSRTERILRDRASIPDQILHDRRFKDVHITPQEALKWGLVEGVREFKLPQGQYISQI